MPHKIRLITISIILFLFPLTNQAQNYDCSNVDKTGLLKKAYASFEKDVFSYYNFGTDSIKAFRTFLAEVASLSLDLRKLPSDNSIRLTREFKGRIGTKNSIWIRLSDYEKNEAAKKSYTPSSTSSKTNKEEILIFNYRGGFIQCLKNTNNSKEFKELIYKLENDGNISTSLIAQKIYYLKDEEINTPQIKKYIAFDIYYSILMVIEKAFK